MHRISTIKRRVLRFPLTLRHLLVYLDFALRQYGRLSMIIIGRSGLGAKYYLARILILIQLLRYRFWKVMRNSALFQICVPINIIFLYIIESVDFLVAQSRIIQPIWHLVVLFPRSQVLIRLVEGTVHCLMYLRLDAQLRPFV